MMSAAENKQIVQNIFDELAQGNSRPLVESMAYDFCWTVTGSNRWSGKYEGKQKVLEELLGQLRARIDGRIKTIGHRFIAEGDYVQWKRAATTPRRPANHITIPIVL